MEKSLRIAMLSTHSCPLGPLGSRDTGGMSVYVREVGGELGRLGHRVDIYTRIHNTAEAPVTELGENTRLIHLKAGDEELKKIAIYPYIPEFAYYLESFRKENDLEYDLIFSHYWLSGCAGELARIWWRVPHLIMFHTLAAVKRAIGEKEPELRLKTETDLARSCDGIITATMREKENLVRYYGAPPERINVIPCGVKMNLFKPLPREAAREALGLQGREIILFVGRIEPLKGVERLIRAVRLLKNRPARLVVIGGDSENATEIGRLRMLAGELGISELVSFPGRVPQEELPRYYSAANVTVIPSYYESFGLVALESLACGTPVVATDVGDLKNILEIGKTGFIAERGTPQDIAEKIGLTLENGGSLSPAKIRESVRRFSWQNTARGVVRGCLSASAEYSETRLSSLMCRALSF